MSTLEGWLEAAMPMWAANCPDALTAQRLPELTHLVSVTHKVYPLAILSYRTSPEKSLLRYNFSHSVTLPNGPALQHSLEHMELKPAGALTKPGQWTHKHKRSH